VALIVVVDASVVIAFLDARDRHHARAVDALRASGNDTVVLPASAYAEVLVRPLQRGPAAGAVVDAVVADLGIRVEPITGEIARRAAGLRASHPRLRLPDALVLATGDALDAARILTADGLWPQVSRRARVI
jgi:predicted nucleic acid-binding protein